MLPLQIEEQPLSMADIKTLYPSKGVSDVIIDFYVRYIYHNQLSHYHHRFHFKCSVMISKTNFKVLQVVSSLTYESIKRALYDTYHKKHPTDVAKEALLKTHSTTTGRAPLWDSNFVAFPCKPR